MRLTIRGEYARDWRDIADRAKEQAGHRCVRCGHPNGDRMFGGARILKQCTVECTHLRDSKLRMLTVHHLDGDKSNNRWWNLLVLCQVCHLSVQARVIPERPWLFAHTPWFRPYVAGFYAWYHAGLNLTRVEVEARLDELLALGQPWLATGRSA